MHLEFLDTWGPIAGMRRHRESPSPPPSHVSSKEEARSALHHPSGLGCTPAAGPGERKTCADCGVGNLGVLHREEGHGPWLGLKPEEGQSGFSLDHGVLGRGPSCLGPSLRLCQGTPGTWRTGAHGAHPSFLLALVRHWTRVMGPLCFAELWVWGAGPTLSRTSGLLSSTSPSLPN